MKFRWLFLLFLSVVVSDAWAVVGRPLTPVSYAGVARRTSRRTARRTTYRTEAMVNTLPSDCVRSGPYYSCAGAYYQPYYDGPDLVYVEVDRPSS